MIKLSGSVKKILKSTHQIGGIANLIKINCDMLINSTREKDYEDKTLMQVSLLESIKWCVKEMTAQIEKIEQTEEISKLIAQLTDNMDK